MNVPELQGLEENSLCEFTWQAIIGVWLNNPLVDLVLLGVWIGAFTTNDRQGAAIWRNPKAGPPDFWERMRMALFFLPALGRRTFSVGRALEDLMAQHPAEPHWYLGVLGTDPAHQGRGVGSALLAPILARCDATAHAAYLEASRIENVPFYQRCGFEVVGEYELRDGPKVWRMHRTPRG